MQESVDSQFLMYDPEWLDQNKEIVLQQGIPASLFVDSVEVKKLSDQYLCPLCLDILWKPVECQNCRKNYCQSCVQYYNQCPTCRNEFIPLKTHPVIYSTLSNSDFKCLFSKMYGCKAIVKYEQFEKHINSCIYRQPNRNEIKSIEITNYNINQDSMFKKQYISYQIQITLYCNETYSINKRYGDFFLLHQELYSDQEILGRIIPQLPEKFFDFYSLVGYSPSNKNDILQRQICLEAYLNLLNQNPIFSKRDTLKKFLSQQSQNNMDQNDANIQKKAKAFMEYMKNMIKNKDTSIQLLQQKIQTLWIRDIGLDSKSLEENEQLCKEYKVSIEAIFDYLIKNICNCNKTIDDLEQKQKSNSNEESKKEKQFQSTIEAVYEEFSNMIKHEIEVIAQNKKQMSSLLLKIAMCLSRMNGFLDILNRLKQITIEYTCTIEQKLKCIDEKQKEILDQKIINYKKTLEMSQRNLEQDSNQLKEDISSNISQFIEEFEQVHQSSYIPQIDYYEKINKKYKPNNNDSIFYQIKDMILNNINKE